jgi:hypothetical protein
MGKLLLSGYFSIMVQMFEHVAKGRLKTFGHRYTAHRAMGIPTLCSSY